MNNIEQQILELRERLNNYNYHYYVLSQPLISDFEFDKLLAELQKLEDAHPEFFDANSPTQRVGSDINQNFTQVKHEYPMLSLGNTYNEGEVADFYNRVANALNAPFEISVLVDSKSSASPKRWKISQGASKLFSPVVSFMFLFFTVVFSKSQKGVALNACINTVN